jgi:hypothetical protein
MRKILWMTILVLAGAAPLFAQMPTIGSLVNPPAFQKYAAPVSSRLAFLASDKGKQFLLQAPSPMARKLLQRYHGAAAAAQWDKTPHQYMNYGAPSGARSLGNSPNVATAMAVLPRAAVTRCSATRFNLEPAANALPQNEQSIDFKFQGGSTTAADMAVEVSNDFRGFFLSPAVFSPSISGYYVEDTAGCAPRYEGGTPPIPDPLFSGNDLIGAGDPIINFDPNHDAWFYSSIYESPFDDGAGVFRNTTANLKSANCRSGTQNVLTSTICWANGPVTAGLNAIVADEQTVNFVDKPDSWVDSRTSGTGAGDVYIVDTLFSKVGANIDLTACTNNLSACSASENISPSDFSTQFSDVKTKANGTITVTYGEFYTISTFTRSIFAVDIKYVTCTPNGAPIAPTCSAPVKIATDFAPIVDGLTELDLVRNSTYPTHVETAHGSYVFWEHCGSSSDLPFGENLICPDADIVGSVNTGTGWSAPFAVDTAAGHQIQPWATYDSSADKIVITYQDCDSSTTTRQACRAGYRTITPTGGTTVGAFNALSAYAFPQAEANSGFFDPLFGDYIGASAHNGHYWAGYTDTSRVGIYGFGTKSANESNNNVAAVDNP